LILHFFFLCVCLDFLFCLELASQFLVVEVEYRSIAVDYLVAFESLVEINFFKQVEQIPVLRCISVVDEYELVDAVAVLELLLEIME
jgi:hypothetical protein